MRRGIRAIHSQAVGQARSLVQKLGAVHFGKEQVVPAHALQDLIRQIEGLTGRMVLPPAWSEWFCPQCGPLDPEEVTFYEQCDHCGQPVCDKPEVERQLKAWQETSSMYADMAGTYYQVLQELAEILGPEVYRCDDGTVQDSILILKIPELVRALKQKEGTCVSGEG